MANALPTLVPTPARVVEMERLGDQIAELSAHLDAASAQLLDLIREFDVRGGWNNGFRSCAAWLSWRVGLDLGAARERVRVARALGRLPVLSEALARGELSYAKVRAITRVATPETERRLLAVGRAGTAAHVERIVRGWRQVDARAEMRRTNRLHEQRGVHIHHDDDGTVVLRARLTPEVGALVTRALDAAREVLYRRAAAAADSARADSPTPQRETDTHSGAARCKTAEAISRRELDADEDAIAAPADDVPTRRTLTTKHEEAPAAEPTSVESDAGAAADGRPAGVEDPPPTAAQQRADALALLAEAALHGGLDPGAPGERYQVVVHVDAATLSDAAHAGHSALEDGEGVSAKTSRRLACDASRVVLRHDDAGRVVEIGARTRTIPPALRRALHDRDRACRFPGCGVRFAEGHHLRHWAHGGPTTLSNLALLCRRHHRAVHEEGFNVERSPDGTLAFRRPDGQPLPDVPRPPAVAPNPAARIRERHGANGLRIDARSLRARWLGERLDVGWAIDVLHPLPNRLPAPRE